MYHVVYFFDLRFVYVLFLYLLCMYYYLFEGFFCSLLLTVSAGDTTHYCD